MHGWHALSATAAVHLPMTLCGGQCFRWRRTPRDTWVGVVQHGVYELHNAAHPPGCQGGNRRTSERRAVHSSSSPSSSFVDTGVNVVWFRCLHRELKNASDVLMEAHFLHHYLALDVDLQQLWRRWTIDNPMCDHPLVRYLTSGEGKELPVSIRHLRQDLHETLLAFLCSQNNNVQRITGLVEKMATCYGNHLCDYNLVTGDVENINTFDDNVSHEKRVKQLRKSKNRRDGEWISLHSMPSIDQLVKITEEDLRGLGFGYRSKYIIQSASIIHSSGVTNKKMKSNGINGRIERHSYKWYDDLLDGKLSLSARREKLLSLPGVGRKVSDCVLLFAVGHHDIVPVDTHMAQVATEYLAGTASCKQESVCQRNRKRSRNEKLSPTKVSKDVSSWEMVLVDWYSKGKARDMKMPALLPKHHDAIQMGFQSLFGDYCGWAHSILFYERMRRRKQET